MLKLVVFLFSICALSTVASHVVCNNERGPKLCNHQLFQQILVVCDSLENAQFVDETLPRCCCSFGCSDAYLRKTLCPQTALERFL